ncbi:kinase-like domain-containing protein [Hyaloraphidium curvatum]|nr:kinase-like domain-containing protein [Hyaloraphidium curvatum]
MIHVTQQVLGYGSHGTVVYRGSFQGRECAVKRLLLDFYDVADHEVNLLRESDDHPNVVRYFAREECDRFMYIALELCPASVYDIVERANVPEFRKLGESLGPQRVMYQMMSGIAYLHRLKMVHRDIKPQNILISQGKPSQPPRVVISDFGLGKKLEDNQSSFNNTLHTAAGTVGWRAPECMAPRGSEPGTPAEGDPPSSSREFGTGARITRAVDIFSAGCVFYYILSGGEHPFGDRYEREANILRGNFRLDRLQGMGEEGVEAMDLISAMIARDAKASRPSAKDVLIHPYFWTPAQRLSFLQDASDRFEVEVRDPPSAILQRLEAGAPEVVGADWHKRLDKSVIDNLGKHRKYDGALIRDLLRALRNKKHHYQDLPENVKRHLGSVPEGFLSYFTNRFPHLLLHVYRVVAEDEGLRNENIFKPYFEVGDRFK